MTKICGKDNCNNPTIPRGKYCEDHRTGKLCNAPDCKKNARGVFI